MVGVNRIEFFFCCNMWRVMYASVAHFCRSFGHINLIASSADLVFVHKLNVGVYLINRMKLTTSACRELIL